MKRVLSFDFGASSGRAMLCTFDGEKISMEEIHRFSNDPVTVGGRMYWDVLRLFFEIKAGITKAVNAGGFDAVGIDTWGVDFGLIDKRGNLLGNPVHYRDNRTEGVWEEVFKIVPKEELYLRTGTQFMRFNTLYQLMYLKLYEPEMLENAQKMLLMPDLFCYLLTGEMCAEASIASTTNLYDPHRRGWDFELIEKLGFDKKLFPKIIKSGQQMGILSDEICAELGCEKVPVIAVAEHDTACAVAATPAETKDFVYISCGTWSLFGIESEEPIISPTVADMNFTNEGGFQDTVRFLKNIMGLWLIQESRRQWKREGCEVGFDTLEKEALASEPFRCFVDVDDPLFESAGNLPERVREYCRKTGQYVPQNRGEIMRCIYQSLAMKYRYTFQKLREITGRDYQCIHMLGGGIKDKLLCQLAANACGVKVLAGPVEATATGNAAVVFSALHEISDFSQLRQVSAASAKLAVYLPQDSADWQEAFKNYVCLLEK